MSACQHDQIVPVESGLPGDVQTVAYLCAECSQRVVGNLHCHDCRWEDIYLFGQAVPFKRACIEFCGAHSLNQWSPADSL